MTFAPESLEAIPRVSTAASADLLRPPDPTTPTLVADFASAIANESLQAPRKRAHENFPYPLSHLSDLERPMGKWIMDEDVNTLFPANIRMNEDGEINPRCPKILFSDEEIQAFYKPWSKASCSRFTVLCNDSEGPRELESAPTHYVKAVRPEKPSNSFQGLPPLSDKTNREVNPFTEILKKMNIPVKAVVERTLKMGDDALVLVPISYTEPLFESPPIFNPSVNKKKASR
ncbi:hypothetical protein LINPERHAP2_LOCUS37822 [Linum perenne]